MNHARKSVAVASAGILALSLVIAPSDLEKTRADVVYPVRLTAHTLPPLPSPQALLKKIVVVPTTARTAGSAPEPSSEPATYSAQPFAAAQAVPVEAILGPFTPILGVLAIAVLFGAIAVPIVIACPVCAIVNELSYLPSLFFEFLGYFTPVAAVAPLAAVAAEPPVTTMTALAQEDDPSVAADKVETFETSEVDHTSTDAASDAEDTTAADITEAADTEATDTAATDTEAVDTDAAVTAEEPSTEPTEVTSPETDSAAADSESVEPSASESEPKQTEQTAPHGPDRDQSADATGTSNVNSAGADSSGGDADGSR